MSNGSKKGSIEERMVEIANNPDHCFWIEGNSARETLAGYGMQRVARFELTDEQTISLFWEVEDGKKWTEIVYAQVIGDRIVRIGASKGPFGKRFGTDRDRWLTDAFAAKIGTHLNGKPRRGRKPCRLIVGSRRFTPTKRRNSKRKPARTRST